MVERSANTSQSDPVNLCAPYLVKLPVTGAAISLSSGSQQETICCSDAVAGKLDELQFELGEGPRWDALASRLPVLVPDTADGWHTRWPVFGNAVRATEVRAMFVFPLVLGAIDIGVVELYRNRPGALSGASQAVASNLTETTSWTLLRRILAQEPDHDGSFGGTEGSSLSRREIHQATGMVLAQANVSATDALLLLRGYAFSESRPLKDVAADVIERRLDFKPNPQRAE
ncbi:GAF and ANTAR domain-containing protein [Arthrobacter sp. 260]|uniref:GAF and ANTAR domain-containing protein n=1 Tax=Arthrobacter sp. 260 TaxID=2735314 RepID=UPI0014910B06|nr:GAF and ANTAR domain-containing protein [Arthrobacter sp. 260]NOJ60247.1 GAF and ANTAR domain-containing protein [Arthrobacter sp. 260]